MAVFSVESWPCSLLTFASVFKFVRKNKINRFSPIFVVNNVPLAWRIRWRYCPPALFVHPPHARLSTRNALVAISSFRCQNTIRLIHYWIALEWPSHAHTSGEIAGRSSNKTPAANNHRCFLLDNRRECIQWKRCFPMHINHGNELNILAKFVALKLIRQCTAASESGIAGSLPRE